MSSATTCVISEQPFQGIGSLRRTLSAVDMSSPSGVSQNDFSDQQQQPGQFDIWCFIQIQKPSYLPPAYVHPLAKKSKSCLSLKSLEICTENLGSESGSSNISLSDTDDQEHKEKEEAEEAIQEVVVDETKILEAGKVDVKQVAVMNYGKKSSVPSAAPRSFPPPLKSLSKPGGGGIQMKTHRKDGRLVLEAVPVHASQNCFSAQRQDGRLVLTFASPVPESKSFDSEEVTIECSLDNALRNHNGRRKRQRNSAEND